MAYDATGTLIADMGTQQVSEKFRKREFVLEIQDGQYPQSVKFELAQDKCDLLNGYEVGTPVTVSFDLRGRAYDKNGATMYFTTLSAWKVANANGGGQQPQGGGYSQQGGQSQGGQQQQAPRPMANNNPAMQRPANAAPPVSSDADNDLPF